MSSLLQQQGAYLCKWILYIDVLYNNTISGIILYQVLP